MKDYHSSFITVDDGTKIHVTEAGKGQPLIMLAGGGFSSEIFRYQIDCFAEHYRVLALSMRAQGKSDRVLHGLRVCRLAKDLKNIIDILDLDEVNVIAHSLGCSILYCFYDLFSPGKFRRLVLIDEPLVLTENPAWSEETKLNYGATYKASSNHELINQMTSGDFGEIKKSIVSAMTTKQASNEIREFIKRCFDIDPKAAALLYYNNLNQDWRDVPPRITHPTLIVGGRSSITPWQSQQWLKEQIEKSEIRIFEENEGGSHFMFVENPSLFNQLALNFFGS